LTDSNPEINVEGNELDKTIVRGKKNVVIINNGTIIFNNGSENASADDTRDHCDYTIVVGLDGAYQEKQEFTGARHAYARFNALIAEHFGEACLDVYLFITNTKGRQFVKHYSSRQFGNEPNPSARSFYSVEASNRNDNVAKTFKKSDTYCQDAWRLVNTYLPYTNATMKMRVVKANGDVFMRCLTVTADAWEKPEFFPAISHFSD
jgi:hypothetical protein